MEANIVLVENPTRAMWRAIAEPLARYHEEQVGQRADHQLVVMTLAADHSDEISGGLWATTAYANLHLNCCSFLPNSEVADLARDCSSLPSKRQRGGVVVRHGWRRTVSVPRRFTNTAATPASASYPITQWVIRAYSCANH